MLLKLLEGFSRSFRTRGGEETHSSQNLLIWDCTVPLLEGAQLWKVLFAADVKVTLTVY